MGHLSRLRKFGELNVSRHQVNAFRVVQDTLTGLDWLIHQNTAHSIGQVSLVNAMSRETILRQYLDTVKGQYSHILIDCQPSLGMLTVNALAAANRVIIDGCFGILVWKRRGTLRQW